ncbi:MAG: anti-sigma factor [Planctomycetota bacterium]|jgi:hypothetical protein
MKAEPCEKYREWIKQYSCSELNPDDTETLLEHTQQCAACRASLEVLDEQEQKMAQWVKSLEPLIQTGQGQTVDRLRRMPEQTRRAAGSGLNRWRLAGCAAAACILIVAGFLAGRGQRPALDVDQLQQQWAAAIQPQMEKQVTASVLQSLRPGVVAEYAKMQDALSDQISLQLKAYAEETVAHNDVQIYQLLTGLIEAIEAAQIENQQWALSAMSELEGQRLRDQEVVHSQFVALAAYTGNELLRTQQEIEALASKQN